MSIARTFPIMNEMSSEPRHAPIPWGIIAPHEPQALLNHDQTLERLAQRGGLAPSEAVAVLEDRPWRKMESHVARQRLAEIVNTVILDAVFTELK